jgi:hydroxymethylbilane synthase
LHLRVATRGSKLSLVQTDLVIERLRKHNPNFSVEKKIIPTRGDLDKTTPLFLLDQKGIFEKEVNQAVLGGDADFAVHSMKDLPVHEGHSGLVIAGVPERASPADVLVTRRNQRLEDLKQGAVVGTSSLLRLAQLRRVRPDLLTEPIRGNVETRIMKVENGEYDAVVLAEAGVSRLGLESKISQRLSLQDFIPAPGQGIIAPMARESTETVKILEEIEHFPTNAEGEAERELVKVLEGGCKAPIGALAVASEGRIQVTGYVLSVDGKKRLEATRSGSADNALGLGRDVGEDLLGQGAKSLEEGWRRIYR